MAREVNALGESVRAKEMAVRTMAASGRPFTVNETHGILLRPEHRIMNYDDFVARAQQASQTALNASFAATTEQFKALAKDLQQACNSCHHTYRRP
jgi:cytochrome c556